ncbi:glycine cleavage system protein T [Halovibrio salipaludis]|uniref:aminomethyltransferase n=1 Tax=Halovibrio salipaludis TaxID=2032626 RepID=A0A2A2F7D7_9GAMM|nr:glycine cleavage system aminomethyltransferase GcvT [Halovibrio salipaludis]PAU81346.1 glycine cleavage system protein T [Halovibrio salipaludis]
MANDQAMLTTPLTALHEELGARMVPFAGYSMPVQYPAGIKQEHLHTREGAGLFDVSHMGQVWLSGEGIAEALEAMVPSDLVGLGMHRQRYGLFTNEDGGVLDDLMISRHEDGFYLVVNAACKAEDIAHLRAGLPASVTLTEMTDRALIALQGPKAEEALAKLQPEVRKMKFMDNWPMTLLDSPAIISRSGYTGEDGYEISVPAEVAETLARRLLEDEHVEPVGLGARDSLRLEAGLCLYGHDITTRTTPVEASLGWAIGKARRLGGEREGGFPGAQRVLQQMRDSAPEQKRVGLVAEGKAPVREGAVLYAEGGDEPIGEVTSGNFAASVGAPIAMGYVRADLAEKGTTVEADVRGKRRSMTVSSMPFLRPGYQR